MSEPASHELVRTSAGDLAVRSVQAQEIMHPGVGPRREARELYVEQSGLARRLGERAAEGSEGDPLTLFDVGLGAGSNALGAWEESELAGAGARRLRIVSFEQDLGALGLALSAGAAFGFSEEGVRAARTLLQTGQHQAPRTSWLLRWGDVLATMAQEPTRADLVFWDPFSPRVNPELWTVAAFAGMRARASQTCTLFTYSSSTTIRVALLLAGWAVGVGAAIGSKRETTAAAVRVEDLAQPLDARFLRRLGRSGAPLPVDAPPDARERVAAAFQFQGPR